MKLFSQIFKSKAEIVNISFREAEAATLIASNKKNAESIKRYLQGFINTSGTDGTPDLQLTISKSETGNNIAITGTDVLTVLNRLLRRNPCPFSGQCINEIELMNSNQQPNSQNNEDRDSNVVIPKDGFSAF